MIREKLIFTLPQPTGEPVPLTYSEIFGVNYYDHWDFNNVASMALTGTFIDRISSLSGSGRNFTGLSANRPVLLDDVATGRKVAVFDGVTDFMSISGTAGAYNFLHDGSGGCVIVVMNQDSGTSNVGIILRNFAGSADRGISEVAVESSGSYNTAAARGVSSSFAINNATGSGLTSGSWNSKVAVYDADNATAADRSEVYINNGSAYKNNTLTNAPTASNASEILTMGILPPANVSFPYDGRIAEIVIANTIPTATQLTQIQERLEYDYGTFPI